MRDTLVALYQLQQIDLKVLEIERAAAQLPSRIKELEAELEKERAVMGAARMELEAKRTEQRDNETLIRDEGEKLQKWKRRLIDIKTPREYQALSREVEQTERQIREAEERVLAIMAEIESKAGAINEKESAFRAAESEATTKVRELRERMAAISRDALEAKTGRAPLVEKLPPKILQLYERVRERRAGVAVAIAQNGTCMGCNVAVRPQLMVEIRRLDTLEQCPGCSRLLVLDAVIVGAGLMAPPPPPKAS
ncbi:MAG: C4-type zinc ribbon domain-containing protein [Myxococcota bacterium]